MSYFYSIENPQADISLRHLGLTRQNFWRFRDVELDLDKNEVIVKTQSGGNEHQCLCLYLPEETVRNIELNGKKHEKDCIQILESFIKRHKHFLRSEDVGEDRKMCHYIFRFTQETPSKVW